MNLPMNNNALSIKEVAEYFKVSTRTIRDWLKRDESFPRPFKKFGTLRFRREEIDKYWAKNTWGKRNII
ncbi:MAG: helix-turn-helix domain-containing protein [Deltaproteobacteria bacterium]|nr:helix-turn-helix domain-containing protein [Deltaproteobacteria bacterium]